MKRSLRSRGFSLLELLAALTIASLLVTLVPPAFSRVIPSIRFDANVRELVTTLREARTAAVARSTSIDVVLNTDPPGFVLPGSPDRRFGSHVRLLVNGKEVDEHHIRFYPDGSSSGADISLALSSRAYALRVDWLLGGVRFEQGAGDVH